MVAFVTDREKAGEILEKLGLPAEPPVTARARAPPLHEELFEPAPEVFAPEPIYPDG